MIVAIASNLVPDKRNIFLFNPEKIILKIIDLAYAKKYNAPISAICGSFDYISPEMLKILKTGNASFTDEKPDIYALGNCLKIVWGFLFAVNIRCELTFEVMECTYREFFEGISPTLSLDLFARITAAISNMTEQDPQNRSTIFAALQEFQDIYNEYKLSLPREREFFGLKNCSGLPFFPASSRVHANNVVLHTYNPQYGIV